MNPKSYKKACLAFTVPGEPGPGQAEELVRRTLRRQGRPLWPGMVIRVIPGRDGSLVLATPLPAERVYISRAALEFLRDSFEKGSSGGFPGY